jgi:hypothetical protein
VAIGESTLQSRRRYTAKRSYTACTAAAEYCVEHQLKLLAVLLLIAPIFKILSKNTCITIPVELFFSLQFHKNYPLENYLSIYNSNAIPAGIKSTAFV